MNIVDEYCIKFDLAEIDDIHRRLVEHRERRDLLITSIQSKCSHRDTVCETEDGVNRVCSFCGLVDSRDLDGFWHQDMPSPTKTISHDLAFKLKRS